MVECCDRCGARIRNNMGRSVNASDFFHGYVYLCSKCKNLIDKKITDIRKKYYKEWLKFKNEVEW